MRKKQQCGVRIGPTQSELYKHRRWLESYYPGSENEGSGQLHSYCDVDLHVCFGIHKMK